MKGPTTIIHLPILIAIAVLLARCDPSWIRDDDPDETVIWPLTEGSFWELQAEISGRTVINRAEVTRSVKLPNGAEGQVVRWFRGDQALSEVEAVFTNDADGYYSLGAFSGPDTITQRLRYLPFPGVIGETGHVAEYWVDDGKLVVIDTTLYTLTNVDTTISTPLGQFNCYEFTRVIEFDDVAQDWIVCEYYSPNFGPVKTVVRNEEAPPDQPLFVYTLSRTNVDFTAK